MGRAVVNDEYLAERRVQERRAGLISVGAIACLIVAVVGALVLLAMVWSSFHFSFEDFG